MKPIVNGTNTWAVLHYNGASSSDPAAAQPTGLSAGDIEFEEFNLIVSLSSFLRSDVSRLHCNVPATE